MKNILIISYYWPPYAGSGVQRWLKFSKYLPELGFRPHIYTPENPHFNVKDANLMKDIHPELVEVKRPIWEPYSIADFITGKKSNNQGIVTDKKSGFKPKILNKIRANYFIPDPRKFWIKPSIAFLKKYVSEHNIEFVISTGPPHSMHLIAKGLKEIQPHIKWVADIRDPWSAFDFLKNFGASDRAIGKQENMEREVLESCDHVLATSHQMKDLLIDFDHSKFSCITNGFDQEDFMRYENIETPQEMRLYHAGLLNKVRNPKNLWKALNTLCHQDDQINSMLKLHLVGVVDGDVVEEIKSYKHLKDKIIVEAYKSHEDVIVDYGKADMLLLLVNNTDNAAANIPGKLFEYIATDKSILLMSDKDTDAARIVQEHKSALTCCYNEDIEVDKLRTFLLNAENPPANPEEYKSRFERRQLTKELVNLLNHI